MAKVVLTDTGLLRQTIGQRIAETRRSQGQSQLDLAIQLGASRSKVCHIESGRVMLNLSDLARLQQSHGIDICDICPGNRKPKRSCACVCSCDG